MCSFKWAYFQTILFTLIEVKVLIERYSMQNSPFNLIMKNKVSLLNFCHYRKDYIRKTISLPGNSSAHYLIDLPWNLSVCSSNRCDWFCAKTLIVQCFSNQTNLFFYANIFQFYEKMTLIFTKQNFRQK